NERNYKFAGVLPEELKRRLALVAGLLEIGDREFNSIADAITEHGRKVQAGTLDIPFDSTSLIEYLGKRFRREVDAGAFELTFSSFDPLKTATVLIKELNDFGLHTLADLDRSIPPDFTDRARCEFDTDYPENIPGLLRAAMILNDYKKYFENAWNHHWESASAGLLELLAANHIPWKEIEKYGVRIDDDNEAEDVDTFG